MNRTKIEYCDYTWNPVTGCLHRCPYCYARRTAEGRLKGRFGYPSDDPFRPTYHENRLHEPLAVMKPSVIFVVSMGDLLGSWVPRKWIVDIIGTMADATRHTYLILTKNPGRYAEFYWPYNCWLGTSVEDTDRGHGRVKALKMATGGSSMIRDTRRWLSIEPIQGPSAALIPGIDWIVVGAETGTGARKRRSQAMIEIRVRDILEVAAKHHTPVFLKDNLDLEGELRERPF